MHPASSTSTSASHLVISLQTSAPSSDCNEIPRASNTGGGEGQERSVTEGIETGCFNMISSDPSPTSTSLVIRTTPPSSPPTPPLHSPATTQDLISTLTSSSFVRHPSPPVSPRSSSSTERTVKSYPLPPTSIPDLKRNSSPSPHAYAVVPPSTSTLINNLANNLLATSTKVGRSSSISSDTTFRSRLSSSSSSRGSTDIVPPGSPSISVSILPARWPALDYTSPPAEEEESVLSSEDAEMKEDPLKVEIAGQFYELSCDLPHYKLENLTIANKNDGVLKIFADRWTSDGEFQFNRSIEFGQDADLSKARARFDGDTLRISIPRSLSAPILPVLPLRGAGASTLRSASLRRRQGSVDLTDRTQERESSWDKFCDGERSFEHTGYGGLEETIVEGKVSSS